MIWSNTVTLSAFPQSHLASVAVDTGNPPVFGRVEVWRGGFRSNISVSASFVWRCLSGSTMTPFPHPAHRTGHADFSHPALGQEFHAFAHDTSRPSAVRRTSP